jgi:magnesium transporter
MIVDCAVYADGRRQDAGLAPAEAYDAARAAGGFAWVALDDPGEAELAALAEPFGLHPLAVEDAVHAHQRPKLDRHGSAGLLVLKPVERAGDDGALRFGELLVFVGDGYVITVRHGSVGDLEAVRRELEAGPARLWLGETAVVHAIVDRVVDDYGPVIDALEDEVEDIEEEVFSDERTSPAERIYRANRQAIELHRAVGPLDDPLARLADGELGVPARVRSYFGDVHDHVVHARERLESLRELLGGVLEVNLTKVSVRQNDDMRKISAWAAIAAAPTVIASIYGMNFRYMPELDSPFGYPAAMLVMAGICVGLYRWFRSIGWL